MYQHQKDKNPAESIIVIIIFINVLFLFYF